MSVEFIKYAFVAGELSPTLFGRTDLEKYDLGLARCHNFFVDYRGGISTRPGTQHVDRVPHPFRPTKMFPFRFAPNIANTYVILMGDHYVRFIQNGAYVRKGGEPYELASPYSAGDLEGLKAYQVRDLVRLTHPKYPVRNLIRRGHNDWAIENERIKNEISSPSNVQIKGSGPGDAGVGFVVTAVDASGEESLGSQIVTANNIVNYTTEAGSATVSWDPVVEAQYYNVYRTILIPNTDNDAKIWGGEQVGFVGKTFVPRFVDANIIPDFVTAPPEQYDPFANGAIDHIHVANGGSGFSDGKTKVRIEDPTGRGFQGFGIAANGALIAVVITAGGSGYSNPRVSFPGAVGSEPTTKVLVREYYGREYEIVTTVPGTEPEAPEVEVRVGSVRGNNPSVSAIFQQRQLYAATDNQPMTIFGSRPGLPSNFDVSAVVTDGDSYEHVISSEEISYIEHLKPVRNGLLVFSQTGVWLLHGGEALIVTPTNAAAELQTKTGCSPVPPIEVDADLLYIEGKSPTVRLLTYSELSKGYAGQDMSILSNHLFDGMKIIRWGYARNPHNIIWAVRSDGALLSFTLVKEQNVYAWAVSTTKGVVDDLVVVQEGGQDSVYVTVNRFLNGSWNKYVERLAPRTFEHVEDAWCVDAGLERKHNFPDAELTPGAHTGSNVLFSTDVGAFQEQDKGKVIRVGGGKALIEKVETPRRVRVRVLRDITAVIQEDEAKTPLPAPAGKWTMDRPLTTVGGLEHLNGEVVQILADGNVLPAQKVKGGSVELEFPATRIIIGLGYACVAQTLPPTAASATVEGRRKDVVGTAVRLYDTRGLKVGASPDALYDMKERTTEAYGEPIELQRGIKYMLLDADWDENGQTMYVQEYPLPATILGLVTDMEIGDDTR